MSSRLRPSEPRFLEEAKMLNGELKKIGPTELQKLMHISENLSLEVMKRIEQWKPEGGALAWLLFSGDLYRGLEAKTLTRQDFKFAQKKLRTISGLYGLLRPLDRIQPYRLELGYKLKFNGEGSLYDFWGDKVAKCLPKDEFILNLSSEEYIKVVRPFVDVERIVTPHFLQTRGGSTKFEAIHAKLARGKMARWIIKNRIDSVDLIKGFREDGYNFVEEISTDLKPIFVREIC